jgi:hypothetical protein
MYCAGAFHLVIIDRIAEAPGCAAVIDASDCAVDVGSTG